MVVKIMLMLMSPGKSAGGGGELSLQGGSTRPLHSREAHREATAHNPVTREARIEGQVHRHGT